VKYLKIFIILLITVILLLFFFQNVDIKNVFLHISRVNPIYPLLFLFGSFIQFFIRSYRWGIILKPHKKKISLLTLYDHTLIGYFLNMFLPGRVGEPAKGILLARKEGFPQSSGLASVVLERLIDVFMLITFFLISLNFLRDQSSPFLSNLKTISYYLLPVIVLFFFIFYLVNQKKVFPVVTRIVTWCCRLFPTRFRQKVAESILRFVQGLHFNLSAFDFLKLVLVSILVWCSLIPTYWILMKGFNLNISMLETFPYFCIIGISAAVPTPGMAGSLDAASKITLVELFNVSVDSAAAYTILFHFLVLFLWAVFGLIAFIKQGLSFRLISKVKEGANEMP
jgi:uncharacterized protein (TIRG00374 family)